MAEENDLEDEPMEIVRESKDKEAQIAVEFGEEVEGGVEVRTEHIQMETELPKENEADEERIMKKLIQEWKNLDERFIPETQKQIYKEEFQKYKEKKGKEMDKKTGIAGEKKNNSMGGDNVSKSSRKRGRKTLNETIQMVGEFLVNSRKVIPL